MKDFMESVREGIQDFSTSQKSNEDAVDFIGQSVTFDSCEHNLLNNTQSYVMSVNSKIPSTMFKSLLHFLIIAIAVACISYAIVLLAGLHSAIGLNFIVGFAVGCAYSWLSPIPAYIFYSVSLTSFLLLTNYVSPMICYMAIIIVLFLMYSYILNMAQDTQSIVKYVLTNLGKVTRTGADRMRITVKIIS